MIYIINIHRKERGNMAINRSYRPKAILWVASTLLLLIFIFPLVTLNANAIVAHVALDVVLVIDRSGSMSGAIGSEKTAAKAFIDKMNPLQDQVSIVPFNNSASLFQLSSNYTVAKSYIDGIGTGGGTSYISALNTAQAELSSTRKRVGSMPIIIFMSDGIPSESSATVLAKTDALKAAGIQIFTIYLGTGNSSLLTSMSSSNSATTDHYFNAPSAADLAQIYVSLANVLKAPSIIYVGNYNGNLTLNASTLGPNKTVILKVTGTVTIAGNQYYNPNNNGAKFKDASQLPQLVIIANKIIINNAVTNVDAWLVAKGTDGTVQTCEYTGAQTINTCNNRLTVNGPIMANHLRLLRTAGSGITSASNEPAEVLNLRSDSYLWANARSVSSGRIQTVNTIELPPRF